MNRFEQAFTRRRFLAASALAATAAMPYALGQPVKTAEIEDPLKFKLGLVTYNVAKDWDLPTILRICRAAGIEAVECRTTHKHGVEPSLSADERRTIKKQFADAGVVFWGCGSVCEFHSADPKVVRNNVEECKRFVDLVKDLGGLGVKVRPNGVAKGQTVEQACEQIGQALKPCGQAAADAGIEICVEVHGNVTQLPKHMRAIMDACDHPAVGVTWNSNGTDLIDKSIDVGFELLAKFIRSCHINDLSKDAAGVYPYRELFKKLRGIGYDRYTLIEVAQSVPVEQGIAYLTEYKKLWTELAKP